MVDLAQLLATARAEQRAGDTPAAREAQRAYDRALRDQQNTQRWAAAMEERHALTVELEARLERSERTPLRDIPAGTCSHKRAEYLMGAAAVAGGAIYVDVWDVVGGYPAIGVLPSGDPVADRAMPVAELAAALRAIVRRLARALGPDDEWTVNTLAALDDIERKAAL